MEKLKDTQVIIWYEKALDLNPIADYLHPGLLPIGEAFSDDPIHNLPNLDWIIRHYAYMGVRTFKILSEEPFLGLQNFYKISFDSLSFEFFNIDLLDYLKFMENGKYSEKYSMIISGYIFSNADFHHALLYHTKHIHEATLLSFRGLKYQVGLVDIEDSTSIVENFREKPIDNTKLINSNILILTNSRIKNIKINELINKYNPMENTIHQLINHIQKNLVLKNYELIGIDGEPLRVMNLSSIEVWIKMNVKQFLSNYHFLLEYQIGDT